MWNKPLVVAIGGGVISPIVLGVLGIIWYWATGGDLISALGGLTEADLQRPGIVGKLTGAKSMEPELKMVNYIVSIYKGKTIFDQRDKNAKAPAILAQPENSQLNEFPLRTLVLEGYKIVGVSWSPSTEFQSLPAFQRINVREEQGMVYLTALASGSKTLSDDAVIEIVVYVTYVKG